MFSKCNAHLIRSATGWLNDERSPPTTLLCDFERLCFEVRPCDVLLVEGRSRVSEVIKTITNSTWSHAALYIGRLSEIGDPETRDEIARRIDCDVGEQLVLEARLGRGTIVERLDYYRQDHVRICRPRGLTPGDARKVIAYAVAHLGWDYDVRQLLDLARFLIPYGVLPRRWRSSLFEYNAGQSTRTVCSSLLAMAFAEVQYPIRPIQGRGEDGRTQLFQRNPRLFTPSDFDYSPYFDIVKYPCLSFDEAGLYHRLPWSESGLVCNAEGDCFLPATFTPALEETTPALPPATKTAEPEPEAADTSADAATEGELSTHIPEADR